MTKLSEESLKKLTKPELIAFSMNLQEKNESIQHEVKDEVRELKECMKKLEGELALSKNISELLQYRLVNTERQCQTDAQYFRREYVKVAGIPPSVPASDFEKTFSKILEKGGMEVPAKDIDACHRVGKKGGVIVKFLRSVIVKFLRRKDCQQVLSVKKDIRKVIATDLVLPNTTIKLYLNESLCSYYRILWSKSKALFTMGKTYIYFISNDSVKIRLQGTYKRDLQFQLHIQLILESIFLVQT